jgi:hypothetical protein
MAAPVAGLQVAFELKVGLLEAVERVQRGLGDAA